MSRRDFIAKSSLLTASVAAGSKVLGAQSSSAAASTAANSKLNIAICGAGGRGLVAVRGLAMENIVAICDVDEGMAADARKENPNARYFQDYRKMLDAMAGEIDAVTVSTPDHMHFPIAMSAMDHGKHVFVEKPLAHTVWETRQLRLKAAEKGVATQMGNQGHANEGTRLMREWIQAGAIGNVTEVHHWTNRPIWPQGQSRPDHSKLIPVIPDTLAWNTWLGVAPERPYDPAYAPFNWRGWWDFGTGALGDMGCHVMDATFWALDLDSPQWVEAVSTPFSDESPPTAAIITYQYGARGSMPPVKVIWHDGGFTPLLPDVLPADFQLPQSGSLLIGDKGVLMSDTYNASVRIVPEEKMQEFLPNRPPKTIPRIEGGDHFQEWVGACKGGTPAGSNFEYSTRLTEAVVLGNVAIRSRHRIEWDEANLRVTNHEDANRFVTKEYRPGWGV